MTTLSSIETPRPTTDNINGNWTNPKAQSVVAGYGDEQITVTRAASPAQELVFIEFGGQMHWLTRAQAADLAEAVHNVSGMATSTYGAQFLAEAVRAGLARRRISKTLISAKTGITRYRLRKILSGAVPMTHEEHVAISEVRQ